MRSSSFRLWVALIALNLMNLTQIAEAATITLATSPLANSTTSVVRPNIMYVLDNSGSMQWDYLPDYVSSGISGTGSQICWNGTNDTNNRATCSGVGSTGSDVVVPYTTADINYVYYNPENYYQPPIKADKTSYPNSNVTAAYTDGFDASGSMNFKTGTQITSTLSCTPNGTTTVTCATSTEGLTGTFVTFGTGAPSGAYVMAATTAAPFIITLNAAATGSTTSNWTFKTGGYKHQVYCNTGSPTTQQKMGNGSTCKETTDTTSSANLYPSTLFNTVNSYNGPAYYYTMDAMEYCTDSLFTNCVPLADATHTVPAKYRWCNAYVSSTTVGGAIYTGCQDLRNATHTIPDYMGGIAPAVAAVQASANLTINSYILDKNITGITIDGTNVIGLSTFTAGAGGLTSEHAIAVAICTAIHSNTGFSGYDCPTAPPASGALSKTVTIKANIPPAFASYGGTSSTTPSGPNGNVVVVTGDPTISTGVFASGTLTVVASGATVVNDITVGGVSVMTTKPYYFGDTATATTIATKLASLIGNGYSATSIGADITIASSSYGTTPNGKAIVLASTAILAKATVTANSAVGASGGSIGAISVARNATFGSATTTLKNAQSFTGGATTTTVASQIGASVLGGFSATSASNVTTFSAPTSAPNEFNGQTIAIATGGIAATSATGTLTITASGATRVNDITVGGTSVLTTKPYFFGDTATPASICSALAPLITSGGFTASAAACSGTSAVLTFTGPLGTTFNGATITMTGTAVSARGTLTSTAAVGAAIGSTGIISSNGTTIQGAQTFPASSSTSTVATRINAGTGAAFQNGFTGGGTSGATVTIVAPVGNDFNNQNINVNAGTTSGGTAASGTVTILDGNTTTGVANSSKINSLTCGGTNTIATNTVSAGNPGLIANLTTSLAANDANGYTLSGCTAPTGSPQHAACNITGPVGGAACTLSATLTTSPGFSVSGSLAAGTAATTSYTSFNQVKFAPATNGTGGSASAISNAGYEAANGSGSMTTPGTAAVPNYAGSLTAGTFPSATNGASGSATAITNAGYDVATFSSVSMTGGVVSSGPIDNSASPGPLAMSGGADATGGRVSVGKFKRVDIVPSINSYPATGSKNPNRTDCVGTTCTYAEELQNFANWYSYYRTRMLMAKTTSTRAFDQLDSKYRVGFDLLSHYGNNSIDLEVAQFVDTGGETANQRTNWWNKLITADGSGGTPLRSSLLKMGKYYAGKMTSAAAIPAVPAVKPYGSLQITSNTSDGGTITSLKIEGHSMINSAFVVSGCAGSCNSTERQTVTTALFNQITSSPAYTAQVGSATGYTATKSSSTITFTYNSFDTNHNGDAITAVTTGTINAATTDLAHGKDAVPAIPAVVIEPIQYSCQQNYALLVTDGYWNTDSYSDLTQLNGSTQIGNQDNVNSGLTVRPSYDGAMTSTSCTDSAFSSCGTLADIAMYYYKTDLRDSSLGNEISGDTSLDVSTNDVFKSPTDSNQQQHMTLFTMALGIPGTLRYAEDYQTGGSSDYNNIEAGTANWPAPKANDPTTIDDLWHAAVNGRGKYFSAGDPNSVVSGLSEALAAVQVREGSAAAAATSNLQPVAGDNFAYVATYTTVEWAGDLQARYIDLTSGAVSEPVNAAPNECVGDAGCAWSAQHKLDSASWSARNIYVSPTSGATGSALRVFTYGNLTTTEQAYFNPNTLNQYASVFAAHPTDITATKLIDFLRGDVSLEVGNSGSNTEVWRNRAHVLGDIVSTQPIFVKKPGFTYGDPGYNAYIGSQSGREGVVYVSGNDGMLHAFAADDFTDGSASGGDELWAYVPTLQLPYLKDLADTNYTHHYYLDGPITVGDVNFGGGDNDWHTILVGGMGGGGKGYYALDITDPVNPKYLWEFTDANLGYTYGNPSINKLPNNEGWAVLFSSGYNNADGIGRLYALNPKTGVTKTGYPLSTASGTAASPSNLGKVAAWIENLKVNNTATQVYSGDMNGDLWRFELASKTVFKLAHLTDGVTPTPNPQPITTRPEMTLVGSNRVIYVGTGRYLGVTDLPDVNVQSFYAIKDTLGAPNLGGASQATWTPRTDTGTVDGVPSTKLFVLHKIIDTKNNGSKITTTDSLGNSVSARTICIGANSQVESSTGNCINDPTNATDIDWEQSGGWYTDFLLDPGERMNVDMNLTFGTIIFATNVPASSACTTGGRSWLNFIDFKTGLASDGSTIISAQNPNALIVGINVLYLNGKLVTDVVTSSGSASAFDTPGQPSKFSGKRDMWRELDPY